MRQKLLFYAQLRTKRIVIFTTKPVTFIYDNAVRDETRSHLKRLLS